MPPKRPAHERAAAIALLASDACRWLEAEGYLATDQAVQLVILFDGIHACQKGVPHGQ